MTVKTAFFITFLAEFLPIVSYYTYSSFLWLIFLWHGILILQLCFLFFFLINIMTIFTTLKVSSELQSTRRMERPRYIDV